MPVPAALCRERLNRAHAERLRYLSNMDILPPHGQWPIIWRRLFKSPHLQMWERNRLLAFFVQNGVHPDIAADLVLYPNRYSYRATLGPQCSDALRAGYDRAAVNDINDQVRVYKGPLCERQTRLLFAYSVYNFNAGRVV